jgi:hypothetical protein
MTVDGHKLSPRIILNRKTMPKNIPPRLEDATVHSEEEMDADN